MRRIYYICLLIFIMVFCSARSCMEDPEIAAKREEENIINLKDSVRNVFMADSVPDRFLQAYEITAVEKLCDFADYLRIISDTLLDLRFRQQSAELVREMFISGNADLKAWSSIYPVPGLNTPELLLSHSLREGLPFWIQPGQISVSTPFIRENDSTYTGTLSFLQSCISLTDRDTIKNVSAMFFIDIYIKKEFKSFGTEQIRVWEVYLGSFN